jgi:N-acyl-D-amino-acid deacylase
MLDIVIKNGTVIDGTGAAPRQADIAIQSGKIVEVRPNIDAEAAETIDATDRVVAPGWVDVHTHYDGQVTWDSRLDPSAGHGVTTIVTGNCGVGFAPVKPGAEDWLVQLMEGVEDIPGAALSEGIQWGWESFPDYLDTLDRGRYSMDVGTQIPHGALRGYVMGERGAKNEPASNEDIALMSKLVREAIEAGALGFSTSRTLAHRAKDGEPVPGTFADEEELFGIGRAIADAGGGLFEVAQAGLTMLDRGSTAEELDWIARLAERTEIPVSYMVLQTDTDPDLWRSAMDKTTELTDSGLPLWVQVAARPFGMLIGLSTNHPFLKRPTYEAMAHLPLADRAAAMRSPGVADAILSEADSELDPTQPFDGLGPFLQIMLDRMFPMGEVPDYEPLPDSSIGLMATGARPGATQDDKLRAAYELMAAGDGSSMYLLPLFNYTNSNHDAIREMMLHPRSVSSLGDAGAHCGMICDASIPTYLLTHWARDRSRGDKLPIEFLVKKQTHDTARLYGMNDRGTLEAGMRADINVIDYSNLQLLSPKLAHDLPAGGRRLLQEARGYDATLCAGTVVTRDGQDTGARPGRLIRG